MLQGCLGPQLDLAGWYWSLINKLTSGVIKKWHQGVLIFKGINTRRQTWQEFETWPKGRLHWQRLPSAGCPRSDLIFCKEKDYCSPKWEKTLKMQNKRSPWLLIPPVNVSQLCAILSVPLSVKVEQESRVRHTFLNKELSFTTELGQEGSLDSCSSSTSFQQRDRILNSL